MNNRFGRRINEFMLSVGTMDEKIFHSLLRLIHLYVKNHLQISYFSVLDTVSSTEGVHLQTVWGTRDDKGMLYAVDQNRSYSSLRSFAFGENKPLWVVGGSKEILKESNSLKDLWSNIDSLPAFNSTGTDEVRTCVLHPLRKDGNAIGVIEFSTSKHIEPTPSSLEEVQMLATIVSKAHRLHEITQLQREDTETAMLILEKSLESKNWSRLAHPQIFVAYAGDERLEGAAKIEHRSVIDTIKSVLNEFDDLLDVIYWEDVKETGNITDQVIRDISESEFGLCYLSEPFKEEQYHDNANVLFEAGMMQALASSPNAHFSAWIPIREKDSPAPPFDIVGERILNVNRIDGKLDKVSFTTELRGVILALLDVEEGEIEKESFFKSLKERWFST